MSASNDADEALIARWETTAHGIYTGDNATEFARLIALARRATAAEARVEELEQSTADDLRKKGFTVAVHNDYRMSGTAHTFWLLTHSEGSYIKGEGTTDLEALNNARKLLENKP